MLFGEHIVQEYLFVFVGSVITSHGFDLLSGLWLLDFFLPWILSSHNFQWSSNLLGCSLGVSRCSTGLLGYLLSFEERNEAADSNDTNNNNYNSSWSNSCLLLSDSSTFDSKCFFVFPSLPLGSRLLFSINTTDSILPSGQDGIILRLIRLLTFVVGSRLSFFLAF